MSRHRLIDEPCVHVNALAGLEVRASQEGERPRISGYAAVFGSPSQVMADWGGKFREIIAPGAFKETLAKGADVRALLNHDPNYVIGRTKSGTLRLKEDQRGLFYDVDPPETAWAHGLMATVRRGDIDQSSFAFRAIREEWGKGEDDNGDEIDVRTVVEAELFDVSPVTYPAYGATSSAVRKFLAVNSLLSPDEWRRLEDFIRGLRDGPGPSPHPAATPAPAPGPSPHAGDSALERYRRWLDRAESV